MTASAYCMTYEEFEEALDAVREGRATDLARCYLCHLEEFGVADLTEKSTSSPLRGVLKTTTTPGIDPYAASKLSCGHTII